MKSSLPACLARVPARLARIPARFALLFAAICVTCGVAAVALASSGSAAGRTADTSTTTSTTSRVFAPIKTRAACEAKNIARARGSDAGALASQGLSFPAKYTSDGNAANIAAAHTDAQLLVTKVTLPGSTTILARRPAGDHGYLHAIITDTSTSVVNQWQLSTASPAMLIASLETTPPSGSVFAGENDLWAATRSGKITSCSVRANFEWPTVTNVLGSRIVEVVATQLKSGQTGVLISAQSTWVSLRPSSERIPADIRSVRVTATGPGHKHTVSRTFTSATRIGSVTDMIDAMPTEQPAEQTSSCSAAFGANLIGPRTITVTFYGANHQRSALMRYSFYVSAGAGAGVSIGTGSVYSFGACGTGVNLQLGNRWRTPLIGGYFVYKLERLVGMKLL